MSKKPDEHHDGVDADVDGDDEAEADNDDGHQDALEMLTSILQNQGALQSQNQSQQSRQVSTSPDAAAKIGQMMEHLKMAERASAGGGDGERKQHAFWDTQVSEWVGWEL
jgi:hypothetical protein